MRSGLGVSAIIAAYNEEKTIGDVLRVLTQNLLIDEVIVVSDGSTDQTVERAREWDAKTISLRTNCGKGYAMRVGVDNAANGVLLFVDGDMYNVTNAHVAALVMPVLRGDCQMNTGVRDRGALLNFFHLRMQCGPVLSGIRAMRREVFETVPAQYQAHYKIEAALNCFCSRSGYAQQHTILRSLNHVLKESKRGLIDGLRSRWDMSHEVFLLLVELHILEAWKWTPPPADAPVAEYEIYE